jgi:hypothetical protein
MYIFDNLIYNDDRNKGNILIGSDWKLWFIDSTRAFRPYRDLKNQRMIYRCEKGVWKRLKAISPQEFETVLDPFLNSMEIETLIRRHEKLVEHIQSLIRSRGEDLILFEF